MNINKNCHFRDWKILLIKLVISLHCEMTSLVLGRSGLVVAKSSTFGESVTSTR